MVPKIVTRLANIAAKMAGSDKYDPTVEPVTAFEYYLDKAADKVLSIRGLPNRPTTDKNLVLMSTPNGEIWEESSAAKSFTLYAAYPEKTAATRAMTDEEIQLFESVYDCLSNDVPFNLFFNRIIDGSPSIRKQQMFITEFDHKFDQNANVITAEAASTDALVDEFLLTIIKFSFRKYKDKHGEIFYKVLTYAKTFNLTEI